MTPTLQFSIAIPEHPVSMTDRVMATMSLVNDSGAPMYVNARFAVDPVAGDVRVRVSEAGKQVPVRYRIRLRTLQPSDFLLLQPGERLVAAFELTKFFVLSTPGRYSVQGEYVSEGVPQLLATENTFTGRIPAAETTLTIL